MSKHSIADLDARDQYRVYDFHHPDARARSDASALDADYMGPSMTNQADAHAADINNILEKYIQTGILDHQVKYQGQYGDFVDAPTYHEALNAVIAADDMFMTIPAQIRALFNNDPTEFLDFAQNPDNNAKLVEMGLATAVAAPLPSPEAARPQAGAAPGDEVPEAPPRKSSKTASTEA